MENDICEQEISKITEPCGIAAVEGVKEIASLVDDDMKGFFEEDRKAKELTQQEIAKRELELAEEDAINFYFMTLLNNINVYMVIAHPTIPTEEKSIELMFKIIKLLKEKNARRQFISLTTIGYEKSHNKLKFIYYS
jgi:hypothetical protein